MFSFKEIHCFPKWLYHLPCHSSIWRFHFLHPLISTWYYLSFFITAPSGYGIVTHSDLTLQFPVAKWSASCSILLCPLCSFFWSVITCLGHLPTFQLFLFCVCMQAHMCMHVGLQDLGCYFSGTIHTIQFSSETGCLSGLVLNRLDYLLKEPAWLRFVNATHQFPNS